MAYRPKKIGPLSQAPTLEEIEKKMEEGVPLTKLWNIAVEPVVGDIRRKEKEKRKYSKLIPSLEEQLLMRKGELSQLAGKAGIESWVLAKKLRSQSTANAVRVLALLRSMPREKIKEIKTR